MKDKDWNNYVMRKFGTSVRVKIIEAYIPFKKAIDIVKEESSKALGRLEKVNDLINK